MKEYREEILQGIKSKIPPQKIIDNLYHKEFIKYLRFGFKPNIEIIRQSIQEFLNTKFTHNENTFGFVQAVCNGKTLFIGEGNFSFSLSIANEITKPQNITATSLETNNLSDFTQNNIAKLINLGANVHLGIDGTQIDKTFQGYKFDNIIFHFPNTGNIQSIEGKHSNFILLRDFLTSAKPLITNCGRIIITIVDSPYYQGAFQITEVAKITGYNNIEFYSFDVNQHPNYVHTMTTQNKPALGESDKFQTIVFSL